MMWGERCMVGVLGKGGMLSRDCRPGVCIFRRPQQREGIKLWIRLPQRGSRTIAKFILQRA
jgi:hypothetical protein